MRAKPLRLRNKARLRIAALIAAILTASTLPVLGQGVELLTGHGGPIKDIATSPNTDAILTASFDYAVGHWPKDARDTPLWLDGHRAAVNAVIFLNNGLVASAGDDFDILIWNIADGTVTATLPGHQGKILSLARSPDGQWLASASWDGTIGIWSLNTLTLAHQLNVGSNVNDVVFDGSSQALYSAAFDGTIRRWDVATGQEQRIVRRHGFGINKLVMNAEAGWLAYGALDGGTRAIRLSDDAQLADLTLERRPILSLALSPDGTRLAVGDGDGEGFVMTVDTTTWTIIRDFKATLRGPIWALAFSNDGTKLIAGGIDDAAFIWPVDQEADRQMATSERSFLNNPEDMSNGERQFARKCSICHTLTPDTARRAGPSLYHIFGRTSGTLPGYTYSEAMRSADIVWNADTIDRLFALGPDNFIPGSKMPMQRITAPQDRADLLEYLKQNTNDTGEKGD